MAPGGLLLAGRNTVSSIVSTTPLSSLEVQINEHRKALEQPGPQRRCYRSHCLRCQAAGPFAPHDVRRRGLQVIVGSVVREFSIWLARWHCRKCGCVFTDYPDFRTALQAFRRALPVGAGARLS
jgi:hypothetical protein